MSGFICPVCGSPLFSDGKTLSCPKQHCFDIARGGYVNLLMNTAPSAKRHGDDVLMINSRRDFLDKGFYLPLFDEIADMLVPLAAQDVNILDAGCGEGWYTKNLTLQLEQAGIAANITGVDISRDALKAAAKRCSNAAFAVASVFKLPVQTKSCDFVLSVFAPLADAEFARVLKNDAFLLRVVPLEEHLWELKRAVYDVPRKNPPDAEHPEGFELIRKSDVVYSFVLDENSDIKNLFAMTPYYYKTSKADQSKLDKLSRLEVTAAFGIRLWKKK